MSNDIDFMEHRVQASGAIMNCEAFALVVVQDGKFISIRQTRDGVTALGIASYLKLMGVELEDVIYNNDVGDEDE